MLLGTSEGVSSDERISSKLPEEVFVGSSECDLVAGGDGSSLVVVITIGSVVLRKGRGPSCLLMCRGK